jgi:hypothetical protein
MKRENRVNLWLMKRFIKKHFFLLLMIKIISKVAFVYWIFD